MTHIGLAIDPVTNDLQISAGGDLAFVKDSMAVAQHIRERLLTFKGEWFLDTSAGVPWLEELMGQAYDPALAEAVVKAEIMDTDGVIEITSFSITYNPVKRNLQIREIEVITIYNEEVKV